MADFVTLSCPSCGGKLQVTPDLDRFACAHCGNEHVVRRGGGIVSLAPVVEGIDKVRMGVDKTASELAIRRLKEEIAVLLRRREEGLARLQRLRVEATSALQPQPPTKPDLTSGGNLQGAGCVLSLLGVLAWWLAGLTSSQPTGFCALTMLAAAGLAFFSQNEKARRMNASYASDLEAYRKQCAELDGRITAKTGEINSEIAAKTAELDAPIAAKIAELEEHDRTVRIK